MKICISSIGPNLDSLVDPRFGRCSYFIFIDSNDFEKINIVANKGKIAARGAGIQSAQIVVDQGAEAVITGNIGPNSLMVLNSSKIRVFQTISELKVKEALLAFKKNQLPEIKKPVEAGFGALGRGPGRGRGSGYGRGLGRGRRR